MRILFFIFSIALASCFSKENKNETLEKQPHINITKDTFQKKYTLRKYGHVKKFYNRLAPEVTKICIENRVPPGVILSILALESGWGKGYVGQITGNFLSLNAYGKQAELPSLFLPTYKKTGAVLFDPIEIKTIDSSELVWKKRPPSLKRDYRPSPYAGSTENLDYFKNNPDKLTQANLQNVKDFVNRFITYKSSIAAYRNARKLLDNAIAKNGIDILFDPKLNTNFIHTIGGKPNSYNPYESWPKKVIKIMNSVGTIELAKKLHQKSTFNEAWQ